MDVAVAPLTDITAWVRTSGLEIVLFISGAIVLSRAIRRLSSAITTRIDAEHTDGAGLVRSESAKHTHVVVHVTKWAVIVLLYCVVTVLTLRRLGVPLSGIVAPAAVAAVALGFGAQRIVQDVLAGLFIIAERQYGFGDMVRISALGSESGVSGAVEEVTLRITRLRTADGEVVIVPNGQIVQVTNQSRDWARAVVDAPVPGDADINQVREILNQVGIDALADQTLGPLLLDSPTVLGVERIEVDILHLRMVARTLPGKQFTVGRELRARAALAFQENGINVPAKLKTAEPIGTN